MGLLVNPEIQITCQHLVEVLGFRVIIRDSQPFTSPWQHTYMINDSLAPEWLAVHPPTPAGKKESHIGGPGWEVIDENTSALVYISRLLPYSPSFGKILTCLTGNNGELTLHQIIMRNAFHNPKVHESLAEVVERAALTRNNQRVSPLMVPSLPLVYHE